MKVPAPPPDADELLAQALESGRIRTILGSANTNAGTERYEPWDKMRFKPAPDGLTHEEWWLRTKIARRSQQRPLDGLRQMSGRPFTYALTDEILRRTEEINRHASGQISISEQVTNPSTRDTYLVSSLIEEAITSSQLEGAVTSRRDAKEMLRTGRTPRDHSERMIVNNYLAMQRIVALRDTPLTPELVLEIHRVVTEGTLDDPRSAGKLQADDSERVSVFGDGDQVLHRPPAVAELPDRLQALCDFANDASETYVPSVVRSIALHFMMGYDHYFEDGNGRTARAIFYWSMLRQGYWLTEFLTISSVLRAAPARYARSFLYTEQDEGDLTYFLEYHLAVIGRAIDSLHEYLARKAAELKALQAKMRSRPGEFNHRQLAVLDKAVRDPGSTFTTTTHAVDHNVTLETARQDLSALERQGLLHKERVSKRNVWSPAAGLPNLLQG